MQFTFKQFPSTLHININVFVIVNILSILIIGNIIVIIVDRYMEIINNLYNWLSNVKNVIAANLLRKIFRSSEKWHVIYAFYTCRKISSSHQPRKRHHHSVLYNLDETIRDTFKWSTSRNFTFERSRLLVIIKWSSISALRVFAIQVCKERSCD